MAALIAAAKPASAAPGTSPQPPNIVTAPTLIASTSDGNVGYREVGTGSPILLIMGYSGSMDAWEPSFVDALAADHTVIVFDNAGIGDTSALPPPLSISAMAKQTSALIDTLKLNHPAVLGWSMGGMIAQALAVSHPSQVSHLILAATQPGNGKSLPIPAAVVAALSSSNPATLLSVLFPENQTAAANAYVEGILEYPDFYGASATVKTEQNAAAMQWLAGRDPAGHLLRRIRVRTLVSDGTLDEADPTPNDLMLAATIPHARLLLYPDAGHAFLFQDSAAFVPVIDRFLR
jgi:pimeloyl-ACP methyl ester carboxylesterase